MYETLWISRVTTSTYDLVKDFLLPSISWVHKASVFWVMENCGQCHLGTKKIHRLSLPFFEAQIIWAETASILGDGFASPKKRRKQLIFQKHSCFGQGPNKILQCCPPFCWCNLLLELGQNGAIHAMLAWYQGHTSAWHLHHVTFKQPPG